MGEEMKSTTLWIGSEHDEFQVGQLGFLVKKSNHNRGTENFEIRERPAQTNQSLRDTLDGWCGTWNDVGTYARGVARVEKVAQNGRALVRNLDGDELKSALETLGYPELAE